MIVIKQMGSDEALLWLVISFLQPEMNMCGKMYEDVMVVQQPERNMWGKMYKHVMVVDVNYWKEQEWPRL